MFFFFPIPYVSVSLYAYFFCFIFFCLLYNNAFYLANKKIDRSMKAGTIVHACITHTCTYIHLYTHKHTHEKMKTFAIFRVISCTVLFGLFTDVSRTQFPRTMLVLGPGSIHLVTAAMLWPWYTHIEICVAAH